MIMIRKIEKTDASTHLALAQQLDAETEFMVLEPGERKLSIEDQRRFISNVLVQSNSMIFVAVEGAEIIGSIEVIGGHFRRTSHYGDLYMGVRRDYWGQGVGSKLMHAAIEWAKQTSLVRIGLRVMTNNQPAIRLYERFHFVQEGTRLRSFRIDGTFYDEHYMALDLEKEKESSQ